MQITDNYTHKISFVGSKATHKATIFFTSIGHALEYGTAFVPGFFPAMIEPIANPSVATLKEQLDNEQWYMSLNGIQHLHKYPQPFIDWIKEDDTWVITHVHKHNITHLTQLFNLWVNETY